MSILKLFGLILGSGLFFPVSCSTALLVGIEMNSFLFARDMSRGDKPQSPFYVLATVPTGNISPIELYKVDTYIEETPYVSFLLAQPSGALPDEESSWLKGVKWRVISSNSNEQLVEVRYLWGDTSFKNRYRAISHSVSPVSSRMWFRGYMFFCFPWAIGFGLLVYLLGRYLRRKYVVRKSEKVNKCVMTLVIICILGLVAIPQYFAYRETRIRRQQAISDLNKALEINLKDAEAYFKRGNAHMEKGRYEQAISNYTKALEVNPRDADAYGSRGNTYARKGQYEQAISDHTKALEIDPRDAKAYFNRGNTYGREGRYDQASSDLNKALEINPRDAKVYIYRGYAHYFQREYEKSWKDIEKAQYLGHRIDPKFLDDLRKASGRKN